MKNILKLVSLLFATCFILTGCATTRGVIDVSRAISNDVVSSENTKSVIIDNYTDNRQFSTNSSSPDQPTYDPDKGLDDDTKSRIIARKRNTYGKALGDIVLKEGLTTEQLIKNTVSQAFYKAGYNVVTEDPDNKAVHTNIVVDKMWGWLALGWWSVGIRTNADITLEMSYNNKTDSIHSYKEEELRCQLPLTADWEDTIIKNLENIRDDLSEKIKKSSLSN